MPGTADIGLIGLAVMGQNLVLNMDDHGFSVAVFNRTTSKVDQFIAGPAAGTKVIGTHSLEDLVASLAPPRRVMLMVKAGGAVDSVIEDLLPLLDPGDIIIDGGNSHFPDTIRRTSYLEEKGLRFIGTGVSGGEEGARHGPSIMPGGSESAWPFVKDILQSISAKVADGTPCCDWVGSDGAGHFVKMVHNGIEYGDMQVIAEAYHLMKVGLGMSHDEMSSASSSPGTRQNSTPISSRSPPTSLPFDDEAGAPLVEKILDTAGQKGTGKWTAISALDPRDAGDAGRRSGLRQDSLSLKDERVTASQAHGLEHRE